MGDWCAPFVCSTFIGRLADKVEHQVEHDRPEEEHLVFEVCTNQPQVLSDDAPRSGPNVQAGRKVRNFHRYSSPSYSGEILGIGGVRYFAMLRAAMVRKSDRRRARR